jgi:rRNA maturation endonuclease Nob1
MFTIGRSEDKTYDLTCHGLFVDCHQKRGAMSEPSIACPSCGKKIPLTRALRTEIEHASRPAKMLRRSLLRRWRRSKRN